MNSNPTTQRTISGKGLLIILSLPLAIIGALILFSVIADIQKLSVMKTWKQVPAYFLEANLNPEGITNSRGQGSYAYNVTARYEYKYNDKVYVSDRVSIYTDSSNDGYYQELYAQIGKCMETNSCICYVNPEHPHESILSLAIRPNQIGIRTAIGILTLVPFVAAVLFAFGFFSRFQRNPPPLPKPEDVNRMHDYLYMDYLQRVLPRGISETRGKVRFHTTQFGKRSLFLQYSYESIPAVLRIEFPVIQKFWLKLVRQTGSESIDEIQVTDTEVNRKYRTYTNQTENAIHFLNAQEITKSLRKMLDFDHFEIHRGRACVQIFDPKAKNFQQSSLLEMVRQLNLILDIYEQPALQLAAAKIEHSSRCPFCREEISALPDTHAECTQCRTLHHRTCWEENGQCTTWGCAVTSANFS